MNSKEQLEAEAFAAEVKEIKAAEAFANEVAQLKSKPAAKSTNVLDDIINGAKQLGAGATDMLLASPESRGLGKLVPNAVHGIMALPGQIEQLVTGTDYLRNEPAESRFNAGVEQSNQIFDTETPDNWVEGLNRIAGGAIIPLPVKTPPITQGTSIISKVADEGVRAIIPGISEPTVGRVAGAIGVPTVANESIIELADVPDEEYRTIYDAMQDDKVDSILEEVDAEDSFWSKGAGKKIAAAGLMLGLGGVAANKVIRGNRNAKLKDTAVNLGNNPSGIGQETVKPLGDTSLGFVNTDIQSTTTPMQGLQAAMYDANIAIIDKIKNLDEMDIETTEKLASDISRLTGSGSMATTAEFYRTGKFPNSDHRLTLSDGSTFTPNQLLRGYYKLPVEEADALRRILVAGDALDSRKLGAPYAVETGQPLTVSSKGTVEGTRPNAPELNADELYDIQMLVEQYPHLARFKEMTQAITRGVLKDKFDSGLISKDQYYNMLKTRPNYITNAALEGELTTKVKWLDKMDNFSPDEELERFIAKQHLEVTQGRTLETGKGVSNYADPIQMLDKYTQLSLAYHGKKRALKEVIDTVERNGYTTKELGLYEVPTNLVNEGKFNPNNVVISYENGSPRVFEVLDPQFRAALKFQPKVAGRFLTNVVFDLPRKLMQSSNTGSLQPFFAPIAVAYDQAQSIQARKGMRTAGIFGYAGDVTSIFTNLLDVPTRQLGSRILNEGATAMMSDIYAGKGLFSKLPENAVREIATKMQEGYLKTALHRLRYNAALHSAQVVDSETKLISIINSSGANSKAGQVARGYLAAIEMIHEAARYSAGRVNLDRGMPDSLVAWNVKESAGDFTKKGIGDIQPTYKIPEGRAEEWKQFFGKLAGKVEPFDWFTSISAPYYKVNKIAVGTQLKAIKHDPVRLAQAVTLGVVTPAVASTIYMMSNPELRDKYLNDELRSTHFIVPNPLDPNDLIHYPYPIEYVPYASAAQAVTESMILSANPDIKALMPDISDTVLSGINRAYPYGQLSTYMSVPAQGILAQFGKQLPFGGRYADATELSDIPREQVTGLESDIFLGSPLPEWAQEIIYMFGAPGRSMLEGMAASGRAEDNKEVEAFLKSLKSSAQTQTNKATFGFVRKPKDSFTNTTTARYYRKLDKINEAVKVFENMTVNRKNQFIPDSVKPTDEYINIGARLYPIYKSEFVQKMNKQNTLLKKQIEDIDNNPNSTDEDIQKRNAKQKLRQKLVEHMLMQYRSVEKNLGVELEDLDPYKSRQVDNE